MKITNKANLPQVLVDMVQTEKHNKPGCISATTLINGVKQTILIDRHFDEIEEDVEDKVWAIFGTAVHYVIEQQKAKGVYQERFVSHKVGDKTVTGTIDLYDPENKVICDWKTVSVTKILYEQFDDWKSQGLIYAWLLKQNGEEVNKCCFHAFIKDYSPTKANTTANYPQHRIYTYEFDVTEDDLTMIEDFIKTKVQFISDCEKLDDDAIPECNEKERWQSEPEFAVFKKGNKTASRVLESKEKAEGWILAQKEKDRPLFSVVERKAECKRCAGYCSGNKFCSFYKENVEVKA